MKLLILGGTRFLGRHLVEAALSRGHEVTLFNRGKENPTLFPEVETLIGDRNGNLDALRGRTWDAVIDTCGFIPRIVKESVDVLATAVDHYTFISSASVYTNLSKLDIDENHDVLTMALEEANEITKDQNGPMYNEYYGHFKYLCEQVVESVLPSKALHIRAGLIVGPYDYTDRFSYWVQRMASGGEVLAPGKTDREIQVIDARDMSEWVIRMVENKKAGVYNTVGPSEVLTMECLLKACQSVCDNQSTVTWVEESFLHDQEVGYWTELPLWIPEKLNSPGFFNLNINKAIKDGLTFRPLEETIQDTLEWEQERTLNVEDRKSGISLEREAGLLKKWKELAVTKIVKE